MTIPAEITRDLRNGLTLEETLTKHQTNLKTLFKDNKDINRPMKRQGIGEQWRNIQPTRFGSYRIQKEIKGKTNNYGTYRTFEDACIIRDELEQCNWDKTQLQQIIRKHGITPRRQGGWQQ